MAKPNFGTKSADELMGTASSDHILAMAGDDTITGGPGDDRINGGTGIDTAVYSGAFADYIIETRGNGHGPTTISGPDGTDRLINVEQLKFSDVTIDIQTGDVVAVAADTVIVVHTDGTFTPYQGATALNDAVGDAVNGETVRIGSGTFTIDSLLVAQDITITGSEGTEINGGFYIGAGGDGTTIQNVTINGGAAVTGEAGLVGVFVQADDITIENSTFVGDGVSGTADRGILTSITDAQGLVITNNTFEGWDTGVYLNPGTDAQVTSNTFEANFVGLSTDQDATADVTVSGNTFTDSVFEQVGVGVLGANNSEDVGAQVSDNTFEGTAPDVSIYMLASDQTITATSAEDTFIYTNPDAAAVETWTLEGFDTTATSDHLELGSAMITNEDQTTVGGVTLTLDTGDQIQLIGVTDFEDSWLV